MPILDPIPRLLLCPYLVPFQDCFYAHTWSYSKTASMSINLFSSRPLMLSRYLPLQQCYKHIRLLPLFIIPVQGSLGMRLLHSMFDTVVHGSCSSATGADHFFKHGIETRSHFNRDHVCIRACVRVYCAHAHSRG